MSDITSKRLDELDKKIKQLQAQKAAEQARVKAKKKKDDTRRKILVGAYFLEQAEKEDSMQALIEKIDPFLKRATDRRLFGLPDKKNPITE